MSIEAARRLVRSMTGEVVLRLLIEELLAFTAFEDLKIMTDDVLFVG